ncbi:uncharacterized protein LOC131169362 [Hevea brasiliensis]|uniref:uncharacterized protein LOC131169362 n=1 Tax=Hevea brasiliensis TaxID=3981 RepID=UPI0025F6C380|nr:uncharacterized protein LOC131169362 [Hevea brasiliensis]
MDSLIYQYELFKMKLDETISEMYDRFVEIIGGIKSLGNTFTNEELVKKILRNLPKEWLPKVTSLKDSKDLSKVQLDELLGNLIDYEMTLKRDDEDDEFNEEELALMTRRIRKMLFQKKFMPKRNFKKDKGESSKRDPPICFECNKPGQTRMDCPKLKKSFKKFKKKALKATWDKSSDSEDEEIGDQVAQTCFMAMEESSNEVTLNDDVVEFSYDELANALKVMNDELELSHKRNTLLKSELASLRKENETSSKVDRPLDTKDKLDEILDFQRSPSIKYGLGYSKFAQAPPSKTTFVKASSSNEPSPQVPSLKVSNPKGQKPKKSCDNETRKTSFHQHAPRQNVNRTYTSRRVASRPNLYRGHATRPHNYYHTHHASCLHSHNKHKKIDHMRPFAHPHTHRRFNGHCHYCGKIGYTNYRCAIRKIHLGYGRIFDFNDGTTNPQGLKYIWVPKVN